MSRKALPRKARRCGVSCKNFSLKGSPLLYFPHSYGPTSSPGRRRPPSLFLILPFFAARRWDSTVWGLVPPGLRFLATRVFQCFFGAPACGDALWGWRSIFRPRSRWLIAFPIPWSASLPTSRSSLRSCQRRRISVLLGLMTSLGIHPSGDLGCRLSALSLFF